MPSSATITGKTGPASTVTSLALTGVTDVNIACAPKSVMTIFHSKGTSEFDLNATTTITVTPSTGNITLTVSQ